MSQRSPILQKPFVKNERDRAAANIAVGIFGTYFAVHEIVQIRFGRFGYITDLWNQVDLVRIVLAFWSTAALFREPVQDRAVQTEDGILLVYGMVRELFLVTGVFCVLGLIIFLKSTFFLPFSEFVIELITILATLGPFLFVSLWVVFAFAFMYFMVEKWRGMRPIKHRVD